MYSTQYTSFEPSHSVIFLTEAPVYPFWFTMARSRTSHVFLLSTSPTKRPGRGLGVLAVKRRPRLKPTAKKSLQYSLLRLSILRRAERAESMCRLERKTHQANNGKGGSTGSQTSR
jgi:hypothetical protein